jgi:ParB family transcriptional regulator, chromosome partitioning protein
MSRRTGLGRGLAALIPPATEEPREDPPPTAPAVSPPVTAPDDGGPAAGGGWERPAATVPTGDGVPDDPEATADAPDGPAQRSTDPVVDLGYAELEPDRITPNPRQPREVFDPEELEGLATSLADIGMLQPLVVRPLAGGRYELIAGERRWRAARLAGLATVPALVRRTEDADLLKEALVENIHRVQLNPLEEAAAYQQLLQEFDVTQEELASRLGRSRPSISNAIRLLQLPAAIQRRVAAGVLSAGHAKVLLALPDPSEQTRLAERIVAEGLSVRATEEHVRLRLTDVPAPKRAPARRQPTAPGLIELQDDLSDALQARVRISMGARKGKLAVEFTSVEELERIVAVIADGLASGPGRAGAATASASDLEDEEDLSPWRDEAP